MVSNGKKNHKTDTKILNYHNTIQRSRMKILIHFVKKKVRKRLVIGQRNKKKKKSKQNAYLNLLLISQRPKQRSSELFL
jgi:hypothetical protein